MLWGITTFHGILLVFVPLSEFQFNNVYFALNLMKNIFYFFAKLPSLHYQFCCPCFHDKISVEEDTARIIGVYSQTWLSNSVVLSHFMWEIRERQLLYVNKDKISWDTSWDISSATLLLGYNYRCKIKFFMKFGFSFSRYLEKK